MSNQNNMWHRANRRQLNIIGEIYGVKRRWFGLESNAAYRQRIVEVISPKMKI